MTKSELIKLELSLIDSTISRLDRQIQTSKHVCITLWAAWLGWFLTNKAADFIERTAVDHQYFWLIILGSAIFPVIFWIMDFMWRKSLFTASLRQSRISFFLNSKEGIEGLKGMRESNFPLMDPVGWLYDDENYRSQSNKETYLGEIKLSEKGRGIFNTKLSCRKVLCYKEGPWFYVFLIVISIALGAIGFRSSAASTQQPQKHCIKPYKHAHYTVIIDAGSSGSRVFVYYVGAKEEGTIPDITLFGSDEVEGGISEFEDDPLTGTRNIQALLSFAKDTLDHIKHKKISLYLMATAGMRLCTKEKQRRIMKEIRKIIENEGSFDVREVMIISGRYEGLYGWLAINYLDDRFNPDKTREGLLEMGGASTQITFAPTDRFENYKIKRTINNRCYQIYSRSYLYMGTNEAERLLATPSCYPRGYNCKETDGDWKKCNLHIKDKFNALCEGLEHNNGPHCIFKSAIPSIKEKKFVATSSFFHVLDALELSQGLNLDSLLNLADFLCGSDYYTLLDRYNDPKQADYVHTYCISSLYYWNLLKEGYGFPPGQTEISFLNEIKGSKITWALGAVLDMELGYAPEEYKYDQTCL